MCLYPRLIQNPKYTSNKKNGGNIPPVNDPRVLRVPVGCGNCIECRKQKARGWQVRLLEDIRTNTNGKFITLTLSNENYTKINNHIQHHSRPDNSTQHIQGYQRDNQIITQATRWFLERWRKKHKKSIRHWLVSELGHKGTENIHLHGIIWTDNIDEIEKIWQYGFIWKGYYKNGKLNNYVNEQTVNYITKYVSKMDLQHKTYKSIILTSSGIGGNYTKRRDAERNKYNSTETQETYRTRTGHKIAMPTYWRNKIYNDNEREALWLQKLDKQERWICGERIDISKSDKLYYKLLEYHRERNKQLGYGTDNNWKRAEYENARRILVNNTRLTDIGLQPEVNQKEMDLVERREEPRQQPDNAIQKAYKNKFVWKENT